MLGAFIRSTKMLDPFCKDCELLMFCTAISLDKIKLCTDCYSAFHTAGLVIRCGVLTDAVVAVAVADGFDDVVLIGNCSFCGSLRHSPYHAWNLEDHYDTQGILDDAWKEIVEHISEAFGLEMPSATLERRPRFVDGYTPSVLSFRDYMKHVIFPKVYGELPTKETNTHEQDTT
jgi:hypothetical protein